jgi:ADP-ribose pyrophosphatase YjhB (NUDIX family)
MRRQLTATAIVIDSRKQVLLLWHKKYQKWMPPGGHMDENEIPEEAAKRETKEESGLDVEMIGQPNPDFFEHKPSEGHMLKMPYVLLLENVGDNARTGEPAHQHIDFVYLARPIDENQVLSLQEAEGSDIQWFTRTEVADIPSQQIFANLKTFLLHVLDLDPLAQ